MPVGSTSQRSVQVSGFGDYGHLTPLRRLIRFLFVRPAFCLGLPSDSQSPATPLPSANTSPCRVCRGLSPPSRQAHHHSEPDSASHGATRHAWRTIKKPPTGRFLVQERGWLQVMLNNLGIRRTRCLVQERHPAYCLIFVCVFAHE